MCQQGVVRFMPEMRPSGPQGRPSRQFERVQIPKGPHGPHPRQAPSGQKVEISFTKALWRPMHCGGPGGPGVPCPGARCTGGPVGSCGALCGCPGARCIPGALWQPWGPGGPGGPVGAWGRCRTVGTRGALWGLGSDAPGPCTGGPGALHRRPWAQWGPWGPMRFRCTFDAILIKSASN